jgi:hypothetical protein
MLVYPSETWTEPIVSMMGEMATRFLEERVNTTFMVSWESS